MYGTHLLIVMSAAHTCYRYYMANTIEIVQKHTNAGRSTSCWICARHGRRR